jgi:hypothetical protein
MSYTTTMKKTPRHMAAIARTRRRRRSSAADPLKKITLRLHGTVAAAIRALVESGGAPSADAFIEQSVIAHFRERRRLRVYAAYAAAAADAAFMAEMDRTNRAFDVTTGDGLSDARR